MFNFLFNFSFNSGVKFTIKSAEDHIQYSNKDKTKRDRIENLCKYSVIPRKYYNHIFPKRYTYLKSPLQPSLKDLSDWFNFKNIHQASGVSSLITGNVGRLKKQIRLERTMQQLENEIAGRARQILFGEQRNSNMTSKLWPLINLLRHCAIKIPQVPQEPNVYQRTATGI